MTALRTDQIARLVTLPSWKKLAGLGSVRKVKNCDVRDALKEISYLWVLAIKTRVRALLRDGRRVNYYTWLIGTVTNQEPR